MTAAQRQANMGFIFLIVAVATLGGFMFGYDSGAINGTTKGLATTFGLDEANLGLTASSLLPGCALGAFMAGRLADLKGRRWVMVSAAVLFILSALWAGAAHSAVSFAMARFLAGAAVGAASVLSPAYISEVTPANLRGRLSSIQQIMIITGLLGAASSNLMLQRLAGSSLNEIWGAPAWRWMFWVQAVPAVLFLISLMFVPESPRFLVAKGRMDEALAVLTRLFGPDEAPRIAGEIRDSLAKDHQPSMKDLKDPATGKWRRIVWVGIGLAVFQQFVGINVVFYYGIMLWEAVGFTEQQAFTTQVINDAVSVGACIVALMLIDKVGRRPLLLIGSLGMAVTLGLMAFAFTQGTIIEGKLVLPPEMGTLAFVAAISYAALFNLSWGPVMWVLLGEMFPNQMRGSALAVAGAAQWSANFAISSSFPWALKNLGLATAYGFYATCAAISFWFVLKMVTETKGKTLEQMEG
ncbi:sugar porter family MFS transporter [Novosphingobium sp.]|uniref:sugar porter family MFS transporter n=1 Tax=Novosphingobium sp. TaxID=1874826 RepID=UPI00286E4318|nr:sugar porter family MFS transporter [Novosphingobium sp.]